MYAAVLFPSFLNYKAQTPHFFGEGLFNTEISGFGGVRFPI